MQRFLSAIQIVRTGSILLIAIQMKLIGPLVIGKVPLLLEGLEKIMYIVLFKYYLKWINLSKSLNEKWCHFDLKSWITGGTKIRPGIQSNWRIFESNWLGIEGEKTNFTLNTESITIQYINIFVCIHTYLFTDEIYANLNNKYLRICIVENSVEHPTAQLILNSQRKNTLHS